MINFGRLMDGENRDNYDAADIAHWRAVYADMVGFKEQLMAQTRDHVRKVPDTQKELAGVDIPFLEAEMERLQKGLAFWESAQV
jgi:hypothetical protein